MNRFPSTPIDVLEITKGLRTIMNLVCKSAEIFRYWDYPYKKAVTAFEEMNLLDKLYWAYKCRNPVTRAEKGSNLHEYLEKNRKSVYLPSGFKKKDTITFCAVGDLIQYDGLENSKDILYEEVYDLIFDSTISCANLESPITDKKLKKEIISDKESPVECCSRDQFNILKGYKDKFYTVMNTATNHIFDMGIEGIETTSKYLREDDIFYIGMNQEESGQYKGKIIEINGIKVGFASATFGLNGRDLPEGKDYLINVARLLPKNGKYDLTLLEKQIYFCIKEKCDIIITSLHWGYEFEFFPRDRQVEIAHSIIELGADIIIGHHPHVVQPVEYYQTKRDKNRIAIIAYSLGSLIWAYSAPYLVLSGILKLSLANGTFLGEEKTYIENATITPVFRERDNMGDSSVMRIKKLNDCLSNQENTEILEYLSEIKKYSDLVFEKLH